MATNGGKGRKAGHLAAVAPVRVTLAERLTELLRTYGYSQATVAEAVGVTQQTVARWVHGTHTPGPRHLPKLETFLGVPVGHLSALVSGVDLPAPSGVRIPPDLTAAELAAVQAYVDLLVRARAAK